MSSPPPTATSEDAPSLAPITYDLPAPQSANEAVDAQIAQRAARHAARAARFGTTVRPVTETDILGARRAGVRQGFISGIDPATQLAQRAAREARFGRVQEEEPPLNDAATRQKRRERFGEIAEEDVDMQTTLEARRNALSGEKVRENAVHVFGVDDMDTKEVLAVFREYGPSWVEWLNDSSCNVVFEDNVGVKRALQGVGKVEIGGNGNEDGDVLKWRVGGGVWIRAATEDDRRPERPNPESRWSRTVKRKKEKEKLGVAERGREITKSAGGIGRGIGKGKDVPGLDRALEAS